MCIALITTSHPEYPLILLDNRDEFLDRPTASAAFWPEPDNHVLAGRDLLRDEHGTWLGVTRQGRVAVLTNFREESVDHMHPVSGSRSRGAMVNAWLKLPPTSKIKTEQFVADLFSKDGSVKGVGGFSLVCGQIRASDKGLEYPLAVVSNRTPHADAATWIARSPGEVHGLSNSAFDEPWPKVKMGEKLLKEAIDESLAAAEDKKALIARLLALLSVNTLPAREKGESFDSYLGQLRKSIFIPGIGGEILSEAVEKDLASVKDEIGEFGGEKTRPGAHPAPRYGTQKQTVLLVGKTGKVTFVERTRFDSDARAVPLGEGDREYEFEIAA